MSSPLTPRTPARLLRISLLAGCSLLLIAAFRSGPPIEQLPEFNTLKDAASDWSHRVVEWASLIAEDEALEGPEVTEDAQETNAWVAESEPAETFAASSDADTSLPRCSIAGFNVGRWVAREDPGPPRCPHYAELREAPRRTWFSVCRLTHAAPAFSRRWRWQPATCSIDASTPIERVRWLVQNGGIMLFGDSTTRGHFFSLACAFTGLTEVVDAQCRGGRCGGRKPVLLRASLVLTTRGRDLLGIDLPPDFVLGQTPVVSYVRHDFGLGGNEIVRMLRSWGGDFKRMARAFADVLAASANHVADPSSGHISEFHDPNNRFSTLVFSTGLHSKSMAEGFSRQTSVRAFESILARWGQAISNGAREGQRVFIRASVPGTAECAKRDMNHLPPPLEHSTGRPTMLTQVVPFNEAAPAVVEHIPIAQWLDLAHLSQTRSDAHALGDCLHFPVGSGVVEAWSDLLFDQIFSERPL